MLTIIQIFSDDRITLEDILKKQGQTVTRGSISARELMNNPEGDLEWSSLDEVPALTAPEKEN